MFPFLVLIFLLSASASQVDDCTISCESSPKKDACTQGCYYAYALTLAPESPGDRPTCKKACEDNLKGEDVKACETGCEQFEASDGLDGAFGLINVLRDFMSQMFSGTPSDPAAVNLESNSEPFTISRIRIFMPIDQPDMAPDVLSSALSEPSGQTISQSDHIPHHITGHEASVNSKLMSSGEDIECWFRRVFRAPFLLIFLVTLSTLIILVFVQLAMCLRRRSTTPLGYRYAPLPTYTEAINIKVPINDDDEAELKQPLKKQDFDA